MAQNIRSKSVGAGTLTNGAQVDAYWQTKCGGEMTYLGCMSIGDISFPEDTVEQRVCLTGGERKILGTKITASSDPIELELTTDKSLQRHPLEMLIANAGGQRACLEGGYLWIVTLDNCDRSGSFKSAALLERFGPASIQKTGMSAPKTYLVEDESFRTTTFMVRAQELVEMRKTKLQKINSSFGAVNFNGISIFPSNCNSDCGEQLGVCEGWVAFSNAGADIYTHDDILGAYAFQPTGDNVDAVLAFDYGRVIAFTHAAAAVPDYAYADGGAFSAFALADAVAGEYVYSQQCLARIGNKIRVVTSLPGTPASGGYVYESTSSGASWVQLNAAPLGFVVTAVAWGSDADGLAVGLTGEIARTTDGGMTWALVTNAGTPLSAVDYWSDGSAWIGATNGTLYSLPANGTSISAVAIGSTGLTINPTAIKQISIGNDCCGYMLLSAGGNDYVARTYNGRDWELVQANGTAINHLAVCGCDQFKSVGNAGAVYETVD